MLNDYFILLIDIALEVALVSLDLTIPLIYFFFCSSILLRTFITLMDLPTSSTCSNADKRIVIIASLIVNATKFRATPYNTAFGNDWNFFFSVRSGWAATRAQGAGSGFSVSLTMQCCQLAFCYWNAQAWLQRTGRTQFWCLEQSLKLWVIKVNINIITQHFAIRYLAVLLVTRLQWCKERRCVKWVEGKMGREWNG